MASDGFNDWTYNDISLLASNEYLRPNLYQEYTYSSSTPNPPGRGTWHTFPGATDINHINGQWKEEEMFTFTSTETVGGVVVSASVQINGQHVVVASRDYDNEVLSKDKRELEKPLDTAKRLLAEDLATILVALFNGE